MPRDADRIKEEIFAYYPHLDDDDIQGKINASKSAFLYFRAFVPWFHGHLRQLEPDLPASVRELMQTQGRCVGDPHLQNFGVVRTGRNCWGDFTGRFTANDPDDGGKGPVAADMLRFMTGLLVYCPTTDLKPIIKAYLRGLKKKKRKKCLARLERCFLEQADEESGKADKVDFDQRPYRLEELDFSEGYETLQLTVAHGKLVKKEIEKKIRDRLGKRFEVCCTPIHFQKKGGGSGGLKQFRVLLMPKGKCGENSGRLRKAALVMDLKPICRPGIRGWHHPAPPAWEVPSSDDGFKCGTNPNEMIRRVKKTLQLERGKNGRRNFPRTLMLPELGLHLVRVRCKREAGVKMEDVSPDLMALEADVLGRLHADDLGAESAKTFHSRFKAAKTELIRLSESLADRVQADFALIKEL